MTILQNIFTTALWGQLGALLWQIIHAIFGAGTVAVLVLAVASAGCCFEMRMGWKNKPCEQQVEEPAPEPAPVTTGVGK